MVNSREGQMKAKFERFDSSQDLRAKAMEP